MKQAILNYYRDRKKKKNRFIVLKEKLKKEYENFMLNGKRKSEFINIMLEGNCNQNEISFLERYQYCKTIFIARSSIFHR